MKHAFDDAIVRSGRPAVGCRPGSEGWILAATIIGSSMAFIDGTVTNVALPALQGNFHATVVEVQWVVESYGLFLSALILAGGALGDSYGRRLMFLSGVGLFTAASIGCGLSSSIAQLIIARSIQGVGAAFLVPGSLAIIGATFGDSTRGRAIGTWSGFTAITTAVGPVLGGWLIEHASWRWVFFINVPLGAAVVWLSVKHIPESRNPKSTAVDWWGALTATVALAGLVYGFIESSKLGWRNPLVIGSLALGLACLFGFVAVEQWAKSPLVPPTLFKSRVFTGANLLTLLLYSALGIFFFLFPLNLIQVQGYSATATGAAAMPMILFLFFLSRTIAPLTTVVMGSVDRGYAGTASGINNAVARVGGVLAVAVLGIVMVTAFSHHLHRSLPRLNLSPALLNYIDANKIRLAGLELPNLDPATASEVHAAIDQAFVSGFRLVMLICAGLAVASSAVAAVMISAKVQKG